MSTLAFAPSPADLEDLSFAAPILAFRPPVTPPSPARPSAPPDAAPSGLSRR